MKNLFSLGDKKIVSVAAARGGRYSWCSTTKNRWRQFCDFCVANGVTRVEQITHDLIAIYAINRCRDLSVATAQNYISAVNTVLKLLNPNWIACSPKQIVGRSRCSVRKKPLVFEMEQIDSAIADLRKLGHNDLAYIVMFAAWFGLRRREAAMLDLGEALKEALASGAIDIQRGTKGGRGRSVARLIPCDEKQIQLLFKAKQEFKYQQCLIPVGVSLKEFSSRISNICLPVLKKYGITRLHDLRVFYACGRYQALTGSVPPCNNRIGSNLPSQQIDEYARKIISHELGHSRIQIVSSYIGRKLRKRSHCHD